VPVVFAVTAGGGSTTGDSVITGPDGIARVGSWMLGTTTGINSLTATVQGVAPVTFTVSADPGTPASVAVVSGNAQTAVVGTAVSIPPAAIVKDFYGNVVPGVQVTFAPATGSGTVTNSIATADANGIARVGSWTVGTVTGAQTLIATVPGLPSVTIEAIATFGPPSLLGASAGNNLSAVIRTAVAVAPSVVVRDRFGNPVAGALVTFAVTAGGGSVIGATQATDVNGVAGVGSWVLGAAAGPNTLTAQVAGITPVAFNATAMITPPPPSTAYGITIRYVTPATARQQLAVERAVARWQSVVTGDVSDVDTRANQVAANSCGTHPAIAELIDDIIIFVDFGDIDGVGKTLGQAGPCFIRSSNGLPVIGRLKLDASDLANMETNGTVDDVVLHEIGHVLGIGTVWGSLGVLSFSQTDSVTMTGARAAESFRAQGGITFAGRPVPVENCVGLTTTCGAGTRDGHWRELVMGRELMTGYISPAGQANPLSRITIQSLADIGYAVNINVADGYTVSASLLAAGAQAEPVRLNEAPNDVIIRAIDARGAITPVEARR
jgi:hypothetical protein